MRTLPQALIDHLSLPVTTVCHLLRLELHDGRVFGITDLDVPVVRDGVTYSALNGMNPSAIATDTGLSVDNSEAYALASTMLSAGVTLEMIAAGDLDNAQWTLMIANWADDAMPVGLIDAGDVGRATIKRIDGTYTAELVSYAMRLRQPIGTLDSRTCRAEFGAPNVGQYGCGVDAEALWQSGTVTGLGIEPSRIFADSSLLITPSPIPGRLRFTSGPNATRNRLYQVEAYSSVSGTIALIEDAPFPVSVGDTFDIRPDCAKTLAACKAYGNLINMRAEPYIPVGDGLETGTPSAQVTGGVLGSEVID